ncbi:MAG TPA: prepilin-type N-terminal cleavage/methylation domain-containing protein [Gemmatimonadales bacterium]|jgi:prepilin-type N-terminal cleavage/methylation domain-containing protein|nr:prepilin-type N-terminal cleavage/methylation domain-containing protein [Gemmatimonadales bacterium]
MNRQSRRGFTLAEVLVALAIVGLIALTANRIYAATLGGVDRLRGASRALARHGAGHQLVRSAFLSLDVGRDSAGGFSGRPNDVRFTAWLPTPDGWNERATVRLAVEGRRWVLRGRTGEPPAVLAEPVSDVELDYLLEPGLDARWVREWDSPVSAPLAVRVRIAAPDGAVDTMLYLIRGRG